MGQLLVRNLQDELKSRLRRRAAHNKRSMEEEVREILRDALKQEKTPPGGLGSGIASLFRKTGLEEDIRELRGHAIQPAAFDR